MLHLLNAMRAFEVAARLGSIRRAAEELRVSDGAVSRHIKNLEDELGVPLFERGNRSLRLTPAAATFAATLTEALASINRGTEHLQAQHDQSTIMLTAPDTFLLRWLVPRLQSLEKALGGVSVRITTWTREINPADRSIDVYVGVGKLLDIPGMVVTPVAPETFGPVISPMIAPGRHVDDETIWRLPRLDIRWPPDMWTNWAREAGIALPVRDSVWYDSLSFSVQAAEAGQGVAIGPGPAVWDALEQNRLVAPLGMVTRSGHWFLAWREDRSNRMMQAVRRWFETEMARGLRFEERSTEQARRANRNAQGDGD